MPLTLVFFTRPSKSLLRRDSVRSHKFVVIVWISLLQVPSCPSAAETVHCRKRSAEKNCVPRIYDYDVKCFTKNQSRSKRILC